MPSLPAAPSKSPAGGGAALGTSRTMLFSSKKDDLQEDWRLTRFRRRQRSSAWLIGFARESEGLSRDSLDGSDWVRPPRPARCRWRVAEAVGVHSSADLGGLGHFSGLERCGSIWSCPVCSSVIRAERAREIGMALERAHDLGHGILFTTLTLRHRQTDDLKFTLDVVQKAWRKVTSLPVWRRLAARVGLVGSIRSTEVTYGGNGWHPHSHFAMITALPLTADELASFESELAAIWQRAVSGLGGRLTSRERGVKVLSADGPSGVADYVSKTQEHVGRERRSIALELARGDLKTGRAGSLMPMELLDDASGSRHVRSLWCEYVTATKGRRAFGWSRGLRSQLLPDVEELTDDEVLEKSERGDLVGLIDSSTWDRQYRDSPDLMHAALLLAESVEPPAK